MTRHQPPPTRAADGTYRSQHAVDSLTLPDGPSIVVRRAWMDGWLTLGELAAVIYCAAGTGLGPHMYRRELRQRFRISRKMIAAVIDGLAGRGLLREVTAREPDGTISGLAYDLAPGWQQLLAQQKPGRRSPGRRKAGHIRRIPSTENLPHESESSFTGRATSATMESTLPKAEMNLPQSAAPTEATEVDDSLAAAPLAPAAPVTREDDNPWRSPYLLGWAEDDSITSSVFGPSAPITPDITDELVEAFYSDGAAWLRDAVRRACGGRVHRRLLTDAGMAAVGRLAAGVMAHARDNASDDEIGESGDVSPTVARGAMRVVLQAMQDRWGRRDGHWLNSYAALGKRLAGAMYSTGLTTARDTRVYLPHISEDELAASASDALRIIVEVGGCKVLAPELLRDPNALLVFLAKVAADQGCRRTEVLAALASYVRRLASAGWTFGGQDAKKVDSWESFGRVLAAERRSKTAC